MGRLSRSGASGLLDLLAASAGGGVDAVAVRAEVADLCALEADPAVAFADGEIDRVQRATGTRRIDARLADARAVSGTMTEQDISDWTGAIPGRGNERA